MDRLLVLQTLPNPTAFSPNNALLTLARTLDRSRFAMTVAVPRRGLLTEALEKQGIHVARVAGLRTYRRHDALWRFPAVALKVARLASRVGARLVLSNHAELGPFAAAAARLGGIPWICFLRQADRPAHYYEKYRVARADAVVAVSRAALEAYRAYLARRCLAANSMRVIPTGIDPPAEADTGAMDEPGEYPGPGGHTPTIGTVGLRSVKRPEVLLEIFARLRRRVPSARCLMIGSAEPEHLEKLRTRAVDLGVADGVEFPGQQPDTDRWYGCMNVYAHTSRSEALPKVVLEAMSHSRPVVAFNVGGIAEAVSDGETGLLCAEGDLEAFATALWRVLTDATLARRLGTAGRSRLVRSFSSKAMAEGMMALFDEVLHAQAPGRSPTVRGRM